jgi:hypothetical protein
MKKEIGFLTVLLVVLITFIGCATTPTIPGYTSSSAPVKIDLSTPSPASKVEAKVETEPGRPSVWKETEISKAVKLPRNIEIITPDPNLPESIKVLSGRREGIWGKTDLYLSEQPAVLIFERLESKNSKIKGEIIYAYGPSGPHGRYPASYTSRTVEVDRGKFEIWGSGNTKWVFQLLEDLTIKAILFIDGYEKNSVILSPIL